MIHVELRFFPCSFVVDAITQRLLDDLRVETCVIVLGYSVVDSNDV